MSINTPAALVESFKKSGEFDRLRRDLLAQFQQDDAYAGLKSKIDEIVRQQFARSQMLLYLPPENAFDEVGKEVARNKLLGAATSEAKALNDPAFLTTLQASIKKVLDDEKQVLKAAAEHVTDDGTRTAVSHDIHDTSAVPSNSESQVIAAHQTQETPSPADVPSNAPPSLPTQTKSNIYRGPETIRVDENPASSMIDIQELNNKATAQAEDASDNDIVMADAF